LPGIAGVEDARGVFQLIRSSAHLRSIAILMFLSIVTAQIVDLQFGWAIELEGGNLTFLFGNVYSLMGARSLRLPASPQLLCIKKTRCGRSDASRADHSRRRLRSASRRVGVIPSPPVPCHRHNKDR
jgi:hypothetical protein